MQDKIEFSQVKTKDEKLVFVFQNETCWEHTNSRSYDIILVKYKLKDLFWQQLGYNCLKPGGEILYYR